MQALQWFSPCLLDVHALGSTQGPPQSRNSILLSRIAQAAQNNIGITYNGGEITQPAGTKARRRHVPPTVIPHTNVDGQALAQRHHNSVIRTRSSGYFGRDRRSVATPFGTTESRSPDDIKSLATRKRPRYAPRIHLPMRQTSTLRWLPRLSPDAKINTAKV